MSYLATTRLGAHRQLKIQLMLGLLVGGLIGMLWGWHEGIAALFGVIISAANTLLELWHLRGTVDSVGVGAEKTLRELYRYAMARFAVVIILFALALTLLNLTPLPLVVGFIVGQMASLMRWFIGIGTRSNNG